MSTLRVNKANKYAQVFGAISLAAGSFLPDAGQAETMRISEGKFSLLLNGDYSTGSGSFTHFSPKTGYSDVKITNCTPSVGAELSSGGAAELFFSLDARVCRGSVKPNTSKTMEFIEGMIPGIPGVRDYLSSTINPITHDFMMKGEIKFSDYSAAQKKQFAEQFAELSTKMGVPVSADVTMMIMNQIPANTRVNAQQLFKTIDQVLPGDQSVLGKTFSEYSSAYQRLNNTDTRQFVVDTISKTFEPLEANSGFVPQADLKAGIRANLYDNGTVKAGFESYVGLRAQHWGQFAGMGTCLQPLMGAGVFAEAKLGRGFSLGANAKIESNFPCSFSGESLMYNQNELYKASVGIFAKYTFGAKDDERRPGPTIFNAKALEGWKASVGTTVFLDKPVLSSISEKGFAKETLNRTPEVNLEMSRDLYESKNGLFVEGQVAIGGGMINGVRSSDQARMQSELESRLPSGANLTDAFLKKAGFPREYLTALGINPDLQGEALRKEIIKRAISAHKRPDQSYEGFTANVQAGVKTGLRTKLSENIEGEVYTRGDVGAQITTKTYKGGDTTIGIRPYVSGALGAGVTVKTPGKLIDQWTAGVEAGARYYLPGVDYGTNMGAQTTQGQLSPYVGVRITGKFSLPAPKFLKD